MAADVHLAHVQYGDVEVEEGLLPQMDVAAKLADEGGAYPAGVGAVAEQLGTQALAPLVIPRRCGVESRQQGLTSNAVVRYLLALAVQGAPRQYLVPVACHAHLLSCAKRRQYT
ncbi:hypothetical protein D3C79_789520 [compost metagenome]